MFSLWNMQEQVNRATINFKLFPLLTRLALTQQPKTRPRPASNQPTNGETQC